MPAFSLSSHAAIHPKPHQKPKRFTPIHASKAKQPRLQVGVLSLSQKIPPKQAVIFGKSFTASTVKRLKTFFSQVFLMLARIQAQILFPATKKASKIIYIPIKKTISIGMNLPSDFLKKIFQFWRTKKKVCIPPHIFFF